MYVGVPLDIFKCMSNDWSCNVFTVEIGRIWSQGKVRNDRQAEKSGIIKIYCFIFLWALCVTVCLCIYTGMIVGANVMHNLNFKALFVSWK